MIPCHHPGESRKWAGQAARVSVIPWDSLQYVAEIGSVLLLTYEGSDYAGHTLRQMVSGLFEGRGGPTMLMITGDADSQAWEDIPAFIASIR